MAAGGAMKGGCRKASFAHVELVIEVLSCVSGEPTVLLSFGEITVPLGFRDVGNVFCD